MIPPCPVVLEPGELLLRTFVPTFSNRVSCTIAAARGIGFLALVIALVLGGICTLVITVAFGEVGILFGLLMAPLSMAAFGAPFLATFVWRPPRKWWVTTRRLIVAKGAGHETFPLPDLSHVKARARHQLELTLDGSRVVISPVFAVAELWGAVVTGSALAPVSFPKPDGDAPQPTVTGAICWHGQVFGPVGGRTYGVVVLRSDRVTWIPFSEGWVGDRVMGFFTGILGILIGVSAKDIKPIPPIDALFHQLLRIPSEAEFVTAIDDLAHALNGRRLPLGTARLDEDGQAVRFQMEEGELRVSGINHPDWPAVRARLGPAVP